MAEPTIQELQAKAEEKRARVRSGTPDDAAATPDPPPERTDPCPGGCGTEVTWRPVVIGERVLFDEPPVCEDCKAEREAEERRQVEREEAERRQRARQERRENIRQLLHEAGVNPWAHGDSTLAAFDTTEAGEEPLRATEDFLADVREAGTYDRVRGLYLHGPTGVGKTMLAAALVRELLIDGWQPGAVCMDHAAALITEVQDCYGSDRSVMAVKDRRVDARLWVLDDLGTERPSDDVVRILTEILNQREGRPTLITSNLPPEALENRHPELARVVSRLGPRYYRVVEVQGRDRRHDAR